MVPEQELAVALHSKLCHSDHTEGCFWFYETGDTMWSKQAHSKYLDWALSLFQSLPGMRAEDVIKVVKAI